jgi:hypothetical protein
MIYILALAIFVVADIFIILQNWTAVLVTVVIGGVLLLVAVLVRMMVSRPSRGAPQAGPIPAVPPVIPPAPAPVAPAPVASGPVPVVEVGKNTVLTGSRPAGRTDFPGLFFALEICAVVGLSVLLLMK